MNSPWYARVAARRAITQGDIVVACPVLTWRRESLKLRRKNVAETLKSLVDAVETDAVVMTQACDLEQRKVEDVILCPAIPLSEYRKQWEEAMTAKGQNVTPNAWMSYCGKVRDGFVWNLALLNSGTARGLSTEHRVVDFHEVYTIPVAFLQSLLVHRKAARLRLMPPYREHLSQAFARYFMRVGLPEGIANPW